MAKGINGTIDPDFEQVTKQRDAAESRNLSNGIVSSRKLGISSIDINNINTLFAKSPLILQNRLPNAPNYRDAGSIQDAGGDIYKTYANVVDPTTKVEGFGFEGSDTVNLNYLDEKNPFKDAPGNSMSFDALTTGQKASGTDESTRHHLGFPDLKPHSTLNSVPKEGDTSEILGNVNFNRNKTQNFGSSIDDDRKLQDEAYPNDTRGSYEVEPDADDTNTDTMELFDNVGQYFRRNYTT